MGVRGDRCSCRVWRAAVVTLLSGMPPRHLLVIGVAFGVGFALALVTSRRPVAAERIVTIDRETASHVAAYVGTSTTQTKERVRVVEKTVYQPGGVVTVTKETVRDSETQAATAARAERTDLETREQKTQRAVESTTRPAWLVTAAVGADFDRRLAVGGGLARQIVGPLYLGAQVVRADSRWLGLATLTLTF